MPVGLGMRRTALLQIDQEGLYKACQYGTATGLGR